MKKIQLGCFFLVYFVFIFGLTIVSACEEYASLSVEIDKDRYYAGEIVDGSIVMNNYFNSTARVAINVTLYKEDKIIKISTYNPNIYPGVNQYAIKDILGTVIIPKNTSGVYSLKINAFYGNCAWFASDNFLVQYDDEDVCDNYGSIVADIEKESYFPRELLGGEIRIINNMTNSESVLGIIDLYKNNEKYIRKTKYITIKPGANIFDINNVFGSIEIQDEHVGDFIFVFSMIGDCTWTAKDDFSVIPIENKSGVKEDIVNKIISNNITKEEIKQEFKKLSSSEKKKVIKFLSKQIGNVTDLQQENVGGKEMYNIKTKTVVNFLGFIPIKTNVNILLDPENNTITGIKKPWWGFLAKTKLYKAKSSNTKLIFSEQHLEFEIKSQAITKVKILPQKTGLINLKVNSLEYATDVPLLENAKEYFEIESNKEVSDVVIQFKLLKQNKNPRFFRYSDGWNELKVNKVGEDLIYVYYEALSEGLSIFALDFDEPTLLSSEFSPIGRYSSRLWLGNYTPSEEYLDFIASRYNFNVMPGSGGKIEIIDELRNRSLDINLIHYTNPIFTNTAISYPEEYYSHSNISTNYNNRILSTQFGMYLMNISSLEWRDAIANSTKEIIDLYDYFGVMVDDCGPAIEYRIDFLPDDFVDADKWISEINATLAVIKNKIGGKIMVFNGIYHSPAQNSRELLEVADGAIKEGFIFHLASGEFLTEQYWKILLNWIIEDTQTKYHIANAKFTMNRTVTINERMFQFTSYLLIKNENIIYNLDDFALITGVDNSLVQYYPEMDINLGEPLETYLTVEEYFNSSFNLYEREYENGIVFVNPSTAQVTHNLDKNYLLAVPEGGGVVQDDGSYGGSLSFEEVSQITVPAQSGIIIMNIVEEPLSVCGNGVCEEGETAESCAGDCGFVSVDISFTARNEHDIPYISEFDFVKIFDIDRTVWDWIEPSEGNYNWTNYDKAIQEIESLDATASFKIWCSSSWATEYKIISEEDYRHASMPLDINSYKTFLTKLIERYDNDGIDDMPGLKFSHNYFHMQGEPENHWMGTKEEYVELLDITYDTIKEANPNAKIISGGWNLGDAFDDNPTPEQVEERGSQSPDSDKFEFVKYLLENGTYDIVGTQCNYQPSGLQARMNWIRTFTDKPVWCSDMANAPLLKGLFFDPPYTAEEIPLVHYDYLLSKIESAREAGYERISLQFMYNCLYSGTDDWAYGCFIKNDETKTPAYDALKNYFEESLFVCGNGICEAGETAESCAGDCEEMTFLSVQGDKIIDENGDEIMLRGLHYDAFYVISKPWYFADGQNKSALDQYNTDLASYFFNEEDISNFKELGANVVRLELRLWEIEKEPYVYSEEVLNHLDNTIEKFGKNGIYVILDLHAAGQNILTHNNEYGNLIWFNESFSDRVVALWGVLAERYSENSYIAGYDIINEPQAPNKTSLHDFYQECIDKIREYDNNHILFLEVNLYQKEEILIGGVYDDDNLAVSMHFYDPYLFTNQGLKENPGGQIYPGTYNNVYWDKDKINSEITKFLEFEELAGKPMFFGEFSANVIDGGNYALQWIEDIIDVLNSKGIHYTFFNYRFSFTPSFGYYQPSEELDNEIITLMYQLINNQLNYEDLTMEQKELFLTINYEHFPELTQILEEGFEYNLTTTLVCGNGICEEGENIINCQQDCFVTGFSGDNFGGDIVFYGIHEWKTTPDTLTGFQNIFNETGMEIARFDIYWGMLEPEKGVYNWTLTDELLSTIGNSTSILFTVFSTSEWGSEYGNYRELIAEYYGNEDDPQIYNRPPSSIPINMDDYMDFLDVLVNRYKDRVQYWMIENEVHSATDPYEWDLPFQLPLGLPLVSHFWLGTKEEYVDLLKNSYAKIKEEDSLSTVMAANFMKDETNEEFTDYILKESKNYSDVLALNFYECPEDDINRIVEMKAKMSDFGYENPIWVTEHGEMDIACHTEAIFKQSFNSSEELKLQSEEIVKRQVLAFSAGAQKVFRLTLNRQNEEWDATSK
ncbi:MAG: cellulase family glycosylhydrolase [Nanoarchaeota archaeon]|nr:cellulase family glycosylhydrolase [Nanoarchaeota archaeon]